MSQVNVTKNWQFYKINRLDGVSGLLSLLKKMLRL